MHLQLLVTNSCTGQYRLTTWSVCNALTESYNWSADTALQDNKKTFMDSNPSENSPVYYM